MAFSVRWHSFASAWQCGNIAFRANWGDVPTSVSSWAADPMYGETPPKPVHPLPSREELVSKLMGALLNPVRNFMAMANAPVGAFARTLRAVADQKAAA